MEQDIGGRIHLAIGQDLDAFTIGTLHTMTPNELLQSALSEPQPPAGLSGPVEALWQTKAGNWDAAHDIVNDIHSSVGSWIHAHLHLIEGDIGNARYWYSKAGRPPRSVEEIDEEWLEIAAEVLR